MEASLRPHMENVMPDDPDLDVYVSQAAAAAGLELGPEYRAAVVANLSRIRDMSALFMSFPLPDEVEIAPVFSL